MISALSTRVAGNATPGLDRYSSGRLTEDLRSRSAVQLGGVSASATQGRPSSISLRARTANVPLRDELKNSHHGATATVVAHIALATRPECAALRHDFSRSRIRAITHREAAVERASRTRRAPLSRLHHCRELQGRCWHERAPRSSALLQKTSQAVPVQDGLRESRGRWPSKRRPNGERRTARLRAAFATSAPLPPAPLGTTSEESAADLSHAHAAPKDVPSRKGVPAANSVAANTPQKRRAERCLASWCAGTDLRLVEGCSAADRWPGNVCSLLVAEAYRGDENPLVTRRASGSTPAMSFGTRSPSLVPSSRSPVPRIVACATMCVAPWIAACSGGGGNGDGNGGGQMSQATVIPIVDANNYTSTSSLNVDRVEVSTDYANTQLCWDAAPQDIQCHAL